MREMENIERHILQNISGVKPVHGFPGRGINKKDVWEYEKFP
jgi:hypothetical protein